MYILSEHYKDFRLELENALDVATKRVKGMLPKYSSGDVYPNAYHDGAYVAIPNADIRGSYWEEGFWPGVLWLSYEVTGDEAFRELAEKNVDDFYKRVDENNNIDWHHDTGFLYSPSCVAAYMLTGNQKAKEAAEMAAYSLSRRFRYKGNFIQSMSAEFDEDNYKFIVDTMMNVPLLFWAANETGKEIYREKAIKHIDTTLKNAMREDGTTFHHVLMDRDTGEVKHGLTWQGAGDDTCWSRGQAWVVYGLALAYAYTKNEAVLEPFVRSADYFFDHLPSDYIPYWDFVFTDGSDEPRDNSAAAIAACGILEMARHIPEDKYNMKKYLDKTVLMMKSMIEKHAAKIDSPKEGLLYDCVGAKPQGMWEDGECVPYGDYFYLESLVRATRDWRKYW